MTKHRPSLIERIAEKIGLIQDLHSVKEEPSIERLTEKPNELTNFPPIEKWDNWTEYEATEHPSIVKVLVA